MPGQLYLPLLGMLKTQTLLHLPVLLPDWGYLKGSELQWDKEASTWKSEDAHIPQWEVQSAGPRTQHLQQSTEPRNTATMAELWI